MSHIGVAAFSALATSNFFLTCRAHTIAIQ